MQPDKIKEIFPYIHLKERSKLLTSDERDHFLNILNAALEDTDFRAFSSFGSDLSELILQYIFDKMRTNSQGQWFLDNRVQSTAFETV
jgi:hypothetical protein